MTTILHQVRARGCNLTVVQGDITDESVDAIVNAAGERLSHGGGVAAAIVRAGGEAIRAESDAYIREHGKLETGRATITSGGNLPARFVIHAVGPVWGAGDEVSKLACAITAALEIAEARGFESISFPAISSGIFGFPKELCAATFFDAIENWLDAHPQRGVKEIRFCNFDKPTATIFEREAKRRFG